MMACDVSAVGLGATHAVRVKGEEALEAQHRDHREDAEDELDDGQDENEQRCDPAMPRAHAHQPEFVLRGSARPWRRQRTA